jgi:hypothetical protein
LHHASIGRPGLVEGDRIYHAVSIDRS